MRFGSDSGLPESPSNVISRGAMLRNESAATDRETAPEKKLMIAILRDSMRCVERYRGAKNPSGRRCYQREAEWILSDDTSHVHGFVRVCESLDLETEAVRRTFRLGESAARLPGRRHAKQPHQRSSSC